MQRALGQVGAIIMCHQPDAGRQGTGSELELGLERIEEAERAREREGGAEKSNGSSELAAVDLHLGLALSALRAHGLNGLHDLGARVCVRERIECVETV